MTETITAAAAGTWTLGDRTVNRLGFGALRLVIQSDGSPADSDQSIAVLRRAVELGVNHIDTADFYIHGSRSANELINAALRPYPEDLLIATKVGPLRDRSTGEFTAARPEQLRGQVEQNLRELGVDQLDLVNLRVGMTFDRGEGSLADHFGALAELQQAGLIRHLGISNVSADHLAEAQAIAPVVCVQNQYGLTTRREDDELLRLCGEQGVAFVPFSSIALAKDNDRVDTVARAHGVSPAQVWLAWTLRQGEHVLGIPGTSRVDHLEENIAAGALRLSEKELAMLEQFDQETVTLRRTPRERGLNSF